MSIRLEAAVARWRKAEAAHAKATEQRDRDIRRVLATCRNGRPTVQEVADAFKYSRAYVHRLVKAGPGEKAGASKTSKRKGA